MELKGKTAVITGSTGSLGGAIAVALARAGCNCICQYRHNKAAATELVAKIQSEGQKAIAVGADLACEKDICRLFREAAEFSVPTILINSAGVFERKPLPEISFADAQRTFDINVTSAIIASREFANLIKANFASADSPVATIVNIADTGAIRPWAEYVLYCSSKAGLVGATKSLAKELAPAISVNAVAPGIITWPKDFDEPAKKRQLSFIPANRIGTLDELTSAIIFLCQSDYITGQVLCVDGGRT